MKRFVLAGLILLLTKTTLSDDDYYCDCLYKKYDPECGANGITYYNKCQRKCANVEKAHDGAC